MKAWKGFPKEYWMYWVASSLAGAGSNILQYLLSLYVLELTGSGTLFASMLSIIVFPQILISPFAGVAADRVSKIRMMSLILFGEASILLFYMLLGAAIGLKLALIYVLVVVLEIGEIFYNASAAAILPELVPTEKIRDAVSVSKVDDGIVQVAGPMLAAVIYSNISISGALGVVALVNLAAGGLQFLIHPRYTDQRPAQVVRPTVFLDLREAGSFIRKDRFIRTFIQVLPLVNAFFGATFSVGVMYLLREQYQLSAYAYGLYCSVTATMSLVVPVLAVPLVKKYEPARIFAAATTVIALAIAGISLAAFLGIQNMLPVMLTVVVITLLDCCTIASAIPMQLSSSILIQTSVEKRMLGRVRAMIRMVSLASVSLGEMLFGVVIDFTNVWLTILLGAVGVAVASLMYRKSMDAIPVGPDQEK